MKLSNEMYLGTLGTVKIENNGVRAAVRIGISGAGRIPAHEYTLDAIEKTKHMIILQVY